MGTERAIVRLGISTLLIASCGGAAAVSWHASVSDIPSFAFRSHVVLAVQVALLFFYAALLLLVPVVRALVDGEMPIELSVRGARWREDAYDFGDEFLVRQAKAAETAHQADLAVKKAIRVLRQELKDAQDAQGEITTQVLERIDALEKESGSRRPRR